MNRISRAARPERRLAAALVILPFLTLSGCNEDPPRPAAPEKPETAPPQPDAATSAAPVATLSATADPQQSASGQQEARAAPAATTSLAGIWVGSYNAKKGSVMLPPKVKDAVRQKDDGKLATGTGTVTLTIEPSGDLRGTAQGSLGSGTLVGKVEDDMIRASVFPDDPRAPLAMTGVLIGKQKDGVISAELRVTGPDAMLVRESGFELRQK